MELAECREHLREKERERNEWAKNSKAWKCNESGQSRPCGWLCGAVLWAFQHM